MITLVSTPEYVDPADPSVICRWVASESPNNFRLQRQDWIVTGANNAGFLELTLTEVYTGAAGNDIAVYDEATDAMFVGTVTNVDGTFLILTTDIPWIAGMNIEYLNDNDLHGGYYFEGRLTINDVLHSLTIIASPDKFGFADLDVSGILRIVTSLGKTGDYTARIMREPTKSGKFNFEYRECWYGSNNDWQGHALTAPLTSPVILVDWYYAEAVRSEEQGSNLHDFAADSLNDAPFFNQFENPVYFLGLPFDLSFILPQQALVSPSSEITVTINSYNSNNLLLSAMTESIPIDQLEGYVCSLNINPATIPSGAAYFTASVII